MPKRRGRKKINKNLTDCQLQMLQSVSMSPTFIDLFKIFVVLSQNKIHKSKQEKNIKPNKCTKISSYPHPRITN